MRTYGLLIAGEWVDADETTDVTNPYSGADVGRVARGAAVLERARTRDRAAR